MSKYNGLILLLLVLVSCANNSPVPPNLVVEGWIEQDRPPIVMLHESVSSDKIGSWYTTDELKNLVIHWGKVTISNGDTDVVLTGKMDTMYMPPYIYTTGRIKGEIGKTYTIKAEYGGLTVAGETQLLEPPSFSQVEMKQLKDSTFLIKCKFIEQSNKDGRYAVFVKKYDEKQYTFCLNGVFSTSNLNDTLTINVNKTISNSEDLKTLYYYGDTISLRFSRLDEQAFSFWTKYQTIAISSSFIFSPVYENYPTNLTGGLGYFFAYASSYYNLILNTDTVITY